jgi:hypothetical protein
MTTPKSKRLRGVTIERPFVYGSVSQHLSKTDDSHLFKWTVYVRGVVRHPSLAIVLLLLFF